MSLNLILIYEQKLLSGNAMQGLVEEDLFKLMDDFSINDASCLIAGISPHKYYFDEALLHKHSKAKLLPSYLNLSGNLGVRSA